MILTHVVGLFTNPKKEWQEIREERCSVGFCYLTHVLILAAIPAVAGYIGSTQVGWSLTPGNEIRLTAQSALLISIAFYLAMLVGVWVMGRVIHWMAETYGADPSPNQGIALASFTSTPIFLAGAMAFYPNISLLMLVGLAAIAYTVYLLYIGVPIVMNITREQGFLFASAVLMMGLVVFVGVLVVTVLLWGFGLAPQFTH